MNQTSTPSALLPVSCSIHTNQIAQHGCFFVVAYFLPQSHFSISVLFLFDAVFCQCVLPVFEHFF